MNRSTVVILGAGRPYRGEDPSALIHTSPNRRVLDWILDSFRALPEAEIHFIGGYRVEEVIRRYPRISFAFNPHWKETGALGSLLSAPLPPERSTWVCYADIIFAPETVLSLRDAEGDVVVAVDSTWRHRYRSRLPEDLAAAEKVRLENGRVCDAGPEIPVDRADAEFVGLLRLSPKALEYLFSLRESREQELARGSIPRLISTLRDAGFEIRPVEVKGRWAELNAPQDLARFILGTKAQTLERLKPLVKKSAIGDQVTFPVGAWRDGAQGVLDRIRERFPNRRLAVRSSARSEDGWSSSNAGAFVSVLDVAEAETAEVRAAVDKVIRSYSDEDPGHQVLVQEMLADVRISGVVFTRTLNHAAPWYTVNYDDATASTTSVTSGSGDQLSTAFVHRNARGPKAVAGVLEAVRELEDLVGHDHLDIEFAVTQDGRVHILQLRPVAVEYPAWQPGDEEIDAALRQAERTFAARQSPGPFVLGSRTCFGIMPDWNPAEIIGTKPRRLALGLYRYLVTDEIWARQRAEYGYRDVRPHPLLVELAGHPYIDIRASLNSFVPADLPEALAGRLIEHYLDRLERNPPFHDKLEFEIAFTCRTFDFEAQAKKRLAPAGLKAGEIDLLARSLTEITRRGMARGRVDLDRVAVLESRYGRIMGDALSPLDRAYLLLEDCRNYGTLPFAHLARAGFVAVSLLRSLETVGATTPDQTSAFLNSLQTVARTFEIHGRDVAGGRRSWEEYVESYGHLRPGTYEITSPAYAEDPERYLRPMVKGETDRPASTAPWNATARKAISDRLRAAGLPDDVDAFEEFLRRSIEGREQAKFVFSRNLSRALDAFVEFGAANSVSREELSHLPLEALLELRTGAARSDIGASLKARARDEQSLHRITQAVELPPLILKPEDLRSFALPESHPNFVTSRSVTADTLAVSGRAADNGSLQGRIVLIPQADPGYDWLFGHGIAGLITMYGGANSHMTIRAAEMGLPAAVGVGELLYDRLSRAQALHLDCGARQIRVIR